MRLSRDEILKAEDRGTEEVEVPEWDGSVLVRGMSGSERDAFETSMMVRQGSELVPDMANFRPKVIARCVVDDDGKRLFDEYRDVEALGGKSAAAVERVYAVAARLSGLGGQDVEQMAADLKASPFAGSSSSSPSTSAEPSRNSSPAGPA